MQAQKQNKFNTLKIKLEVRKELLTNNFESNGRKFKIPLL